MLLQEIEPQSDRTLAGRFRDLVEERPDRVGGVGRPDRTPPEDRHANLGRCQLGHGTQAIIQLMTATPERFMASYNRNPGL